MLSFDDAQKLVSEVKCPPFEFDMGYLVSEGKPCPDLWYVQAKLWRENAYKPGEYEYGYGQKLLITPDMHPREVVLKPFVAAREYAEHEVREGFEWRGRKIVGPHIDLDAMWEMANTFEDRTVTLPPDPEDVAPRTGKI